MKIANILAAIVLMALVFSAIGAVTGVYCWENQAETTYAGRTIYVNDISAELESVYVVVTCSGDTLQSGYTDSRGWFEFDYDSTWYDCDFGFFVVQCSLANYYTKLAIDVFTDSTRNEIIAVELSPAHDCSTYTWSASIIDRRTLRPLEGAVATITQLQTTWFCGDSALPWGAGAGGEWTVTSDSDGLLTTDVLRYSIIRVDIPAMGYTETFEMDGDKTAGKLYVAPRGGYRR